MTAPTLELVRNPSPFANPRDFLQNRFVYVTVSPRARGLSIGVNFNPDKLCNFDCVYCEVDRSRPRDDLLDIPAMAAELDSTLKLVRSGGLQDWPRFRTLPPNLLQLKHVCLSGDGEPTLSPKFLEALQTVLHLRALSRAGFFKVVLVTNSSNLDAAQVQEGLTSLTKQDEVWAKLDAGSPEYMHRVNRTEVPLEKILSNILLTARKRPVIIQTLFAAIDGEEPSLAEIDAYAGRLADLRQAGAQIPLVQIYSATRPICNYACEHLPLRRLSQIAQTVRNKTGLKVEIF
jgi:wyosine [tRNA(Phe)-imidazoG37] synthetase (radical SAM superfamily)